MLAGRLFVVKKAAEASLAQARADALAWAAEAERLRTALERIIEIETECPTWWDDPVAGIGAIARAALDPPACEACDGRKPEEETT